MKRTISAEVGKGSVNHNSRKFKAANVDPDRTHLNVEYCNEPIKQVYHKLFDEALERYNAKQTRSDRRIENYYEKIRAGKQEKPFHASGNLKEKKKTQATLKQEYVNLVLGLAIFISANIFNASPAIHSIVMSGYTQRRNKAGEVNDEYVYSIKFLREIFENSVLANVNPMDFCMRFENRSNITSTMLMKKIQPYEIGE